MDSKDVEMGTGAQNRRQLSDLPLQHLTLSNDEVLCDFVHPSLYEKKGIVVQFINQNCSDAATVIGGVRIGLRDVRRLPAYLAKHGAKVKEHGIKFLDRHLKATQSTIGLNETLSEADYSLSYMMASLSEAGRALHPTGRNEGPLFYCLLPALLEETFFHYNEDESHNSSFIVNAYIHLNEAHRRRNVVKNKATEQGKRADGAARVSMPTPSKKPRMSPFRPDFHSMASNLNTLTAEVRQLRAPPPPPPAFPPLPEHRPLVWPPATPLPELPDDL